MAVTNYYTVGGEIIGERTAGQSRLDYIPDALGSVVATVDQTLTVKSTARFKPYGADLATTGTQPLYGWAGKKGYRKSGRPYSDSYARRRHEDVHSGRWTTVDPIWPVEGAYDYCWSSPTRWTDASGLRPTPSCFAWQAPLPTDINCDSATNESVYSYCDWCYHSRNVFIDCYQQCDAIASAYYDKCASEGRKPPRRSYPGESWYPTASIGIRPPDPTPTWYGPVIGWPVSEYLTFKYGRYCGLDVYGEGNAPPLDCLDMACQKHDSCLGTVWKYGDPATQCLCNIHMCKEVSACECYADDCADVKRKLLFYSCGIAAGCPVWLWPF